MITTERSHRQFYFGGDGTGRITGQLDVSKETAVHFK
jgi:hypothetical protein